MSFDDRDETTGTEQAEHFENTWTVETKEWTQAWPAPFKASAPVACNETPWHQWWKARAPAERLNVSRGGHVADIELSPGVIKLQRGPISSAEVQATERQWEDLFWLVDARSMDVEPAPGLNRWVWRMPTEGFVNAGATVLFDLGGGPVLVAERIERVNGEVIIHGHVHGLDEVLEWLCLAPLEERTVRPMAGLHEEVSASW